MTTLTTTRPLRDTGMRPLPWWRMAWVVWRQHRLVLSGVVAILGATALYLLVVGPQVHQAHAAAAACEPAGSAPCQQALNDFSSNHSYPAGVVAALLQVVPPLIGAFVGAPLLAREFETGTFRYAFTQG
ncbi:MAG: hypothetical protein LBS56_01845, partial [Propionibacteriaceae bacterium]|nr:hypothetical protein [Propionibacteriaceae bacterium]